MPSSEQTPLASGAQGRRAPLTVLIAHPSAELYGADRQVVETVRACVQAGAKVIVTVPSSGPLVKSLLTAGARVMTMDIPVLRKSLLTPAGVSRLAWEAVRSLRSSIRMLRKLAPDVVLVNTQITPLWLLAARLARVPALCHLHEAEADIGRALRVALAAPLALADVVVANSQAALSIVTDAWRSLGSRSRVIYNGVADGAPSPSALRQRQSGQELRVLLVGRLSPRKGTDIALDAVGALRSEGRDVRLTLLGTAFEGYEWFESGLRDRAGQEDLRDAVNFVGFADPWEWLESADVVIVPSRVEPFGNVAVEAMLAMRPLIASRTQGLTEIVRHEENGLLATAGCSTSLATAIARLDDDPEFAGQLAERGREDARERFSPERYRHEMWDAVVGIVQRSSDA